MTFPAILSATQSPLAGALALVAGIVAAWLGAGLFPVSTVCCVVVFVTELVLCPVIKAPLIKISVRKEPWLLPDAVVFSLFLFKGLTADPPTRRSDRSSTPGPRRKSPAILARSAAAVPSRYHTTVCFPSLPVLVRYAPGIPTGVISFTLAVL